MSHTPTVPDCANCIHKETCDRAKEGTFCPAFASQQPPARSDHDDPNAAWRTERDYNY